MECGAKRRNGERCKAPAMPNGKCRIHGGKTPTGIALPQTKTGRYSKYLPKALTEQYEQSLADSELLSIRQDIALIDAMVASALPKLETRESGKAWQTIKKSISELRRAFANEDYGRCLVTVDEMVEVVNDELLYYATEEEIRASLEQRRKLGESEQKRLIAMQQTITAEQAVLLYTALLDSVRRNVTDTHALSSIQADFIRFASQQNSQRIEQSELTERN